MSEALCSQDLQLSLLPTILTIDFGDAHYPLFKAEGRAAQRVRRNSLAHSWGSPWIHPRLTLALWVTATHLATPAPHQAGNLVT